MQFSLQSLGASWARRAPWTAGAVLTLSLIAAGVAYMLDRTHAAAGEKDHAAILALERLLSTMKDVETGERGFIITGRDQYLEPYSAGLAAVPREEATVASLIGPDGRLLSDLLDARIKEAAQGIATYRGNGSAAGAASVDSGAGKAIMDRIRSEVAHIQNDTDRRISARNHERTLDDLLRIASIIGLATSCVALGLLAIRRRREQQASQDLFEGVLENAPVGLGILDPSLRIRHVNNALEKMSERALSAAPGMSIWDVIPDLKETLEPRLQRVAQGGRATSAEVEAASKTRADQVRFYQANFYPLQRANDSGKLTGVGMVIADVTARKRAECSTKESEERFRSLVQASASIIWTADPTGAFVCQTALNIDPRSASKVDPVETY